MKKITQKATIKAAMIAGIMTLMFQPFVGLGQYYQLDGNNCNATNGVEWSDADAVLDTDPTAVTASSNLLKFWGGISGKDFVIATEREASGSAFFAFYLNVDCDATNNDTSKSGADVALFYNILNGVIQDFTIYEYNAATSAYVATLNTFTGAVCNSICEDNLTDK